MFSTGNTTVDTVGKINISGTVIPKEWFKTIRKDDGKPYLLAIYILSDIVYWYRPQQVREECSGRLIGYKKKFHNDLLQRSYEDFANDIGEGKQPVKRALKFLEDLGVIRTEFRNYKNAKGKKIVNQLYIDLDVEVLIDLTYPEELGVIKNDNRVLSKLNRGCYQNQSEGVIKIDKTNTKNTTEITTEISSSSSCERKQEEIEEEEKIKNQIDYKALGKEYGHAVDLLVSAILDLSAEQRNKVTYEMADNICRTYKANKSGVVIPKAYIKKCLDSALDGGTPPDRASPKKKGNSFVDSCMARSDIDYVSLENKLLNL